MVNRYPECPHAGDMVHCTGGCWRGILSTDHLCLYPGTPSPITCGERNQHWACPMDYPFSDAYLKEIAKEKKFKDDYQNRKGSRK